MNKDGGIFVRRAKRFPTDQQTIKFLTAHHAVKCILLCHTEPLKRAYVLGFMNLLFIKAGVLTATS